VTSDGERAFAFQQRVLARTSTRIRQLPWGTAYFHDDFPLRYDANMAMVDRPLAGAAADDLVAALDEAYDGFAHREVEFASVADADSVALGMAGHEYAAEHIVVMARRREPDREPDLDVVEELWLDEIQPFTAEVTLREPWGAAPGVAETMAEFRRVLVEGVGARFFAQRLDGRIAGSCELYLDGEIAQIEDVNTLEEFRGRGVARNVVLRAAEEAARSGATFVFLFADEQDWPRHLYGRLGFDEVGQSRLFTRWPEGTARTESKSTDGQ
jgi:ribosomal protein S18 acetylase RimI-like enzyme